jgi:hypothetical protein
MSAAKQRSGIETMGMRDQQVLRWFFGRGLTVFERSTLGSVLERQSLYCRHLEKCEDCKGVGWPKVGQFDLPQKCETCDGNKFIFKRSRTRPSGPVTVNVGNCQEIHLKDEPDSSELEMYAQVMRRMIHLSELDARVLFGFYGFAGARWAEDPNRGRIWGVLPLTDAGKKVIKASESRKSDSDKEQTLTADEVLNVQQELRDLRSGKQVRERHDFLMTLAHEQAEALLVAAVRSWNMAALKTGTPRSGPKATGIHKARSKVAESLDVTDERLLRVQRILLEVIQ